MSAGHSSLGEREFKVYRIDDGTVIDHIPHWQALRVIDILGLEGSDSLVTVGFGFKSEHMGRKDLLKVENRRLTSQEIHRIALVAPQATINLIQDAQVTEKFRVRLPDEVRNLVRCSNPGCITRHEPVPTRFQTLQREPRVRLECHYCQQITADDEIELT